MDSLRRDNGQTPTHGTHRSHQCFIGLQGKAGYEAGCTKHPQWIVTKAHGGIQRRAQTFGGQIADSVEGVDEGHVRQGQGHGVDGEIAPGQIRGDVLAELHIRFAGILGIRLGAMGGDLHQSLSQLHADGAKALALGPHRSRTQWLDDGQDLFRGGISGEVDVDVGVGPPKQRVTDNATHQIQPAAGHLERRAERFRLVK